MPPGWHWTARKALDFRPAFAFVSCPSAKLRKDPFRPVRASLERRLVAVMSGLLARVNRQRLAVVFGLFLLAAGALHAALNDLEVNTDSSQMIDAEEPFRVNARRMDRLFPRLNSQILVIVRADTADQADFAADGLTTRLRARPDHIGEVFAPSVDPFFQRQGLLFLDLEKLMETTSLLSSAAPLLERVIDAPSMVTLFEQLARVSEASEEGISLAVAASAYDEVARTVEALAAGRDMPLSWQAMFGMENDVGVHQRLIVVDPVLDFNSLQPARPAVEALRGIVADLPADMRQAAAFHVTGDPVLRSDELKSVSQGIGLSALVSLLLVSLLLAIGLRSWQFVLAALGALLISLLLTAGFAALAIGELNLVSIAFTVLLIGLGIDFAIHILLHYRERLRLDGAQRAALDGMLRGVGPALVLAAITTSVAFFAFVPTKFDGMAQLGIISGVGVLIAFFVALIFIPAMLGLLPAIAPRATASAAAGERWLSDVIERRAVPIAVLSLMAGAAASVLLPQVRFDADPMNLRDPDSPSVQAFQLLFDKPENAPYRVNYTGDTLAEALAFEQRAEALDEVESAITLTDYVPDNQDDKLAEIDFLAGDLVFVLRDADEVADRLADRSLDRAAARAALDALTESAARIQADAAGAPEAVAAARLQAALTAFRRAATDAPDLYDRLDDALMRFFPMQMMRLQLQMTARPVSFESLPPNIRQRYVAPTGEVRVEVLPAGDVRDPGKRASFVNAVEAVSPDLAGGAYSVLRGAKVVASAMLQASLTALLLGALLIYLIVRSLLFVAMVMAPLVLAGIWTAATGVLVGLPFNFANVIVLPLLIGLGVDSAIHLVMRGRSMAQAGDVFATSTPRAVLLSALTTIASFGSLALSDHRGTASMGLLLMIALAFTLIATMVVLPGLMSLRRRFGWHLPGERDP